MVRGPSKPRHYDQVLSNPHRAQAVSICFMAQLETERRCCCGFEKIDDKAGPSVGGNRNRSLAHVLLIKANIINRLQKNSYGYGFLIILTGGANDPAVMLD